MSALLFEQWSWTGDLHLDFAMLLQNNGCGKSDVEDVIRTGMRIFEQRVASLDMRFPSMVT